MTGRNIESVISDVASWNVLNGYIIGQEDVRSTLKLTMISDENENQFLMFLIFIYLIDPDFITLYRKKNFEILTRMRFWDELAESQFQLVQNTLNKLYTIFWLVGHLVIKTQFAVNHLAINNSQKFVVSSETHFTISSCRSFNNLWTASLPVAGHIATA